jgi:hypothetical protein
MLDAVSLIEEDYRRYAAEVQLGEWEGVPGGVIEFIKRLAQGQSLPSLSLKRIYTFLNTLPFRPAPGTQDPHQPYPARASRIIIMRSVEGERPLTKRRWDRIPESARERDDAVLVVVLEAKWDLQVSSGREEMKFEVGIKS